MPIYHPIIIARTPLYLYTLNEVDLNVPQLLAGCGGWHMNTYLIVKDLTTSGMLSERVKTS